MPSLTPAARRPTQPYRSIAADPPAQRLFRELLASSIVLAEDWDLLEPDDRAALAESREEEDLLDRLVHANLLTSYQAGRLRAGTSFGLMLGNYRVLDRLGAGGMGVVMRAEHARLRRPVAIKVVSTAAEADPRMLPRFNAEMRAVGKLQHPNIVSAVDAGAERSPDGATVLHYFVMEFVPGQDLEALVTTSGPMSAVKACHLIHQIADALVEAHAAGLIHRDLKPSNILVTDEARAKLLDFGLARHGRDRLTEPGTVLGTIGYMAPEQAQDATTVDVRADVYSLGATLFWCLVGKDPFPVGANLTKDLLSRLTQPPPSVRAFKPDLPAGLDAVVSKMMALKPDDRFPDAKAVMRALLPFLDGGARAKPQAPPEEVREPLHALPPSRVPRILIVDDEADIRTFCRLALATDGIPCDEAGDGAAALERLAAVPYDLVLLDIDMPAMNGLEVLKRLRAAPPAPHLKVVMLSGRSSGDDLSQLLAAGASDYLPKPFSIVQLRARAKAALRLKEAQDRTERLNRRLMGLNAELERNLCARDGDLVKARNALVLSLAKLVEVRSTETGAHLLRLQRYCRCLGEEAAAIPAFQSQVDDHFVDLIEACAPLHDIGKVALPDHILMKPGKLDPEERLLMQSHAAVGADTLKAVAKQHGFAMGFLQMAIDIARHHHERFDGTGYPDRLAGQDIPLSARFVAVADVYDALRSRRVYKPALSHHSTVLTMTEASPGHFDPAVLEVFQRCLPKFERIFRDAGD